MGILNATPDSFYNRGDQSTPEALLHLAEKMLEAGATMLDVGGMSTRPGAAEITAEEEWQRIMPILRLLRKQFPESILSLDTYRAEIARRGAGEGIDMINDISAGDIDGEMLPAVAALNLPFIAMHMQGRPQTMQLAPHYADVVQDILDYFIRKIHACEQAGIKDVIIDPGFCFGKTLEQNYALLKGLLQFAILDKVILVGISRESMINKVLHTHPGDALNGTTAAHMIALQQGAGILRVHDVRAAKECIDIWRFYHNA